MVCDESKLVKALMDGFKQGSQRHTFENASKSDVPLMIFHALTW
jgi:hypothetical protein